MLDKIKAVSSAIAIIAVFISTIFGIQQYIDTRIDKKLHSEEVVNYINSKIDNRLHDENTVNYLDTRVEKKVHDNTITNYLDSRINKSITTTDFIGKVKKSIKPTAIFDENGSLLANMGAMNYIANITVNKDKFRDHKDVFVYKITISPREHLNVAPILEVINDSFNISSKRGKKYDWIYTLEPIVIVTDNSSVRSDLLQFRLEIIN